VMSLLIVSKIACQHIFMLSDPAVPRTFVVDCSSKSISFRSFRFCLQFSFF